MEILSDFLKIFLQKRELLYPNGMMLYAYQMNRMEYNDLQNRLKLCCQNYSLTILLKNDYFARCFVLYASEWWRREYKGGSWAWEPIFSSITNQELKNNQIGIRSNAIISALQYWRYRITSRSGKKYLGAIVANGGIPSKFIQNANKNTPLIKILHSSIKFATENISNEYELLSYIKSLQNILPEPIRKEEIYELLTHIVLTIIKLKVDYQLQYDQNPIQTLNQKCPNWKLQFPLLMEDASIEKMLNGFVEIATRSTAERVNGKVPIVERIIDFDDSNELKFSFIFPNNIKANYFSKFFGIKDINILPQTFYINNLDNDNTTVAVVNLILGSKQQYRIRYINNKLNVINSIILCLSSADNKIQSNYLTLLSSIDINKPLVFIKDKNERLILKGNGSTSLKEEECFIAYNDQIQDYSIFGEYIDNILVNDIELKLIKCQKDIEYNDFFVYLNSPNSSNNKYCIDGDIIPYTTIPFIAYRGIPKIVYYDEEGQKNIVPSKYIQYYHQDTLNPITDIYTFFGNVDIKCTHGGFAKTFHSTIFPNDTSFNFSVSKNDLSIIKINNINNIKIEPLILDSIKYTVYNNNEFYFEKTNFNQDKICFKIYWYNNSSLIYLPFPSIGVNFFDECQKNINYTSISLFHLIGKRIRIFDNIKLSSKYQLLLELCQKDNIDNDMDKHLSITRHIYTNDKITEIKLVDFEDNIKNLFGYSKNEDDSIKISIISNNKNLGFINILRYDAQLLIKDNLIYFSENNSCIYNNIDKLITITAINLIDADCQHITIKPNIDEENKTIYWDTKQLDIENNCYILISNKESQININPLILYSEESYSKLPESYKLVLSANNASYKIAKDIITDIFYKNMSNFSSTIWNDIDIFEEIFINYDISLTSLKFWQIICSNEEMLCRLIVYSSSKKSMIKKIKEELISIPATISFSLWKKIIKEYLSYITEIFADKPEIYNFLKQQLSGQFYTLYTLFPEIELAIYYSLWDLFPDFSNILDMKEIIPHISNTNNKNIKELNAEIFTKQTFDENGEVIELSWMQQLQAQNSLNEDNWICLPFDSIYNNLQINFSKELLEIENYLFKLNTFTSFITDVVNFPQICAFYAFYQTNNYNNPDIDNIIKFSIKDFMNFNQNYFIEVYKIAMSIILKYNNSKV